MSHSETTSNDIVSGTENSTKPADALSLDSIPTAVSATSPARGSTAPLSGASSLSSLLDPGAAAEGGAAEGGATGGQGSEPNVLLLEDFTEMERGQRSEPRAGGDVPQGVQPPASSLNFNFGKQGWLCWCVGNNDNNDDSIFRVPFHVKHAQLC